MNSYRSIFLIYTLFIACLTYPYWGAGQVVAPHRQTVELGISEQGDKSEIENRKFSDFTSYFIPSIFEHFNGPRSGWLTLWTDYTELGRQTYHTVGLSPAYLPSFLIAQLTDNPWRFITIFSLMICYLTGIFVILYCREVGLVPIAGLIAGTSLATSPQIFYWLTFPLFPAVWCWSAGAMWAIARLAKRSELFGGAVLAFCVYSLLMTAFPQSIVFQIYILGGYSLYLAYLKWRKSIGEVARFLAILIFSLGFAGAMALPVYWDLARNYAESARVAPAISFFTAALPAFSGVVGGLRSFVLSTIPEVFGNPISESFPFNYDGASISLLYVFFAIYSLFSVFRRTWGWWLAVVVFLLLGFIHPLYILGVKYLGFNLSRCNPLGCITLPLTVIVAYGVDSLVRRSNPKQIARAIVFASVGTLAVVALGIIFILVDAVPIRWGIILSLLILTGCFVAQYWRTRPILLIVAQVVVLISVSYPLILKQDLEKIAIDSPFVEKLREDLPPGSRFAFLAPKTNLLPPNINAELGLRSVHSYNSLSSKRYHTLIKALGGDVIIYGRRNGEISPDFGSVMFWMSNIGLILSSNSSSAENLEPVGEESGIHFYRVKSRMGESLQVPIEENRQLEGFKNLDPRTLPNQIPVKLVDQGDIKEFEVTPTDSSVLVLSQKYHRDWVAQTLVGQNWIEAPSVEINGVFQGVILQTGASRVRLEFKPFVRFTWIGHCLWALVIVILIGSRDWGKFKEISPSKE